MQGPLHPANLTSSPVEMDTALSSCGVAMVTSIVRTAQTRPIAVSTAGPTVPQSLCVLPFPALGGVLALLARDPANKHPRSSVFELR